MERSGLLSICDCMNYILEEEDLLEVFCLANNYLDPGGIFVFDMNTLYKYGRSSATRRLQKTGKREALSGKTALMRNHRSMNMH